MAYENEDLFNQIREKLDIVEVVSNYINLEKKGKNYFGICPFHDDSNPSMSVSKDKQIYRCFVCGAGGNVFNFVSNYENISFIEAASKLGNSVGINIGYKAKAKVDKLEQPDYQAFDILTKYYQNNLHSKDHVEALEYLKKRDIDDDLIKYFKIGVAKNDYSNGTKLLMSKNYSADKLIELGISNKNQYGYNDVFINRIMFPLFDLDGYVIGYSGRIYNSEDNAKYVNTRETTLFKKGELLYNYHNAKNKCLRENSIIVVEGFLDVIRLHSIGIENVVATMGTQVTKFQLDLIKSLSNNVILCMDGDDAGQKAIYTIGSELITMGVNVAVVKLEKKLDPDEYVKTYGKIIFNKKIKSAMSFLDFKLEHLKFGIDLSSYDGIIKYLDKVILELSTMDDEILKDLILTRLSDEFNISKDMLIAKLNNSSVAPIKINEKNVENIPVQSTKMNFQKRFDYASKQLINYMLNNREAYLIYENSETIMPNKQYRALVVEIIYFYKKYGKIDFSEFIMYLKNDDIRNLAIEIYDIPYDDNNMSEVIDDCLKVIDDYNVNQKILKLTEKMKSEYDLFKKKEILEEIVILRGSEENV